MGAAAAAASQAQALQQQQSSVGNVANTMLPGGFGMANIAGMLSNQGPTQSQMQASAAMQTGGQFDPNNANATAIGANTGATGVGGVDPTYGAPLATGSFNANTQNVANGIFGTDMDRQNSVASSTGFGDVIDPANLDPTAGAHLKPPRLKGLI